MSSLTSGLVNRRHPAAFTLIELLVVIAIIVVLAGLGFAGVSGALKTARKAEARAMANQIKLGISSYYAEYGTYPIATNTDANFLAAMTGSTNATGIPNRRGIRFLDIPGKFTNASGIVTPRGLYSEDRSLQVPFNIESDTNYNGRLSRPFEMPGSVAVWVEDPDKPDNFIGTW
jgi:prepilin-type N-terminal cleavage/methylation domain-containing protein